MAALSAKAKRNLSGLTKPHGGSQPRRPKIVPVERILSVNDHAAKHGDYARDGNRGTINRGGTPIARWIRDGKLDESQQRAIQFCISLWDRAQTGTRLVQDLTRVVGQPHASGWSQQEALDELVWLKEQVTRDMWEVFENVCRWDEPAGTAGSILASNKRSSIDAARLCVGWVAHIIATKKGF